MIMVMASKFWLKALSALALALTVLNVNSACWFCMHQPKVPDAAMRFKH